MARENSGWLIIWELVGGFIDLRYPLCMTLAISLCHCVLKDVHRIYINKIMP